MEIYEIKGTLLRTNPQVIRQFLVERDCTFTMLHQILQILLGWKKDTPYEFSKNNSVIEKSGLKKRLGAEKGDTLTYRFGQDYSWAMRLEILDVRNEERQDLPCVVRYRGGNPLQKFKTAAEYNFREREKNSIYAYISDEERKEGQFLIPAVNHRLRVRFGSSLGKQADFEPDFSRCVLAQSCLATHTVAELREAAGYLGVPLKSNLPKDRIVSILAEYYGVTEHIAACLKRLGLREYKTFQGLCRNPGVRVNPYQVNTLLWLGLVGQVRGSGIALTQELLEAYLELLGTGFEVKLLQEQKVSVCIIAGCMLYGAADISIVREMMETCYPKTLRTLQLEKTWEQQEGRLPEEIALYQGVYYQHEVIAARDVGFWIQKISGGKRYLPVRSQLEEIAADGLSFSGKTGEAVKLWLKRELRFYGDTESLEREIYHALSAGASPGDIAQWLIQICGTGYGKKSGKASQIELFLSGLRTGVRQIALGGYTEEEYKAFGLKG